MNSRTCQLIFDLVDAGYQAGGVVVVGIFFIIGSLILFTFRNSVRKFSTSWYPKAVPALLVVLSTVWTTLMFSQTYFEHQRLLEDLQSNRAVLISGVVTEFAPHTSKRKQESFRVNGIEFFYSEARSMPGYHRYSGEDGPIRVGVFVKILHVGNDILRLEVCI